MRQDARFPFFIHCYAATGFKKFKLGTNSFSIKIRGGSDLMQTKIKSGVKRFPAGNFLLFDL
ncbi:hypothetical protein Cabys_2430 [Caldithrix abyssi DSM 13497]|uniref:Uncharacterized protein n=1 Tax=Caldithrix abyssi DSM 13497 TaxID=880073 RepID=A0A1J1C8Z3_CALAY|nr:hypothetical protein Cabys_2430 [Caldithrix abyssi DSM 13497]